MDNLNNQESKRWLLAVAAPREVEAVLSAFGIAALTLPRPWQRCELSNRFDLVYTGVGKANAAGAVARVLDENRHIGVMSVGIAGALPNTHSKNDYRSQIGDVICATESVFADEGVQTSSGFIPCSEIGFAIFDDGSDRKKHEPRVVDWLEAFSDACAPIACVSMCSGTDQRARRVVQSSDAVAEAMEGAAVSLAAHRVSKSMLSAELRVISNTTGERSEQVWDLDEALSKLVAVLGRLDKDLG